jgi:hypothetical protein
MAVIIMMAPAWHGLGFLFLVAAVVFKTLF